MGATLSSFNGRASTPENMAAIIKLAPQYIEILSHCVYNHDEVRALRTFFTSLNSFISDTSPTSIVNLVGGFANLFLLTSTTVEFTSTIQAFYETTLFPYTNVMFDNLPVKLQSQILFFAILQIILFNSQNGSTAFGHSYSLLAQKNFLLTFVKLSGNNLAGTHHFTSSLYKTFFYDNGNITMGNKNVVFLFSPTILVSGSLREVIINNNCNFDNKNSGNDKNGIVSPHCIRPSASGLKINCGAYVSTDCEQVVLISPANFYPALAAVQRILGKPQPFRSATNRRRFLTKKRWAKEPVLEICQDPCCPSSSSVSSYHGTEVDGLVPPFLPQYHRANTRGCATGTNNTFNNAFNNTFDNERGFGPCSKGGDNDDYSQDSNKGKSKNKNKFSNNNDDGGRRSRKDKDACCDVTCKGCSSCGFSNGFGGNFNTLTIREKIVKDCSSSSSSSSSRCSSSSSSCCEQEVPPLFDGSISQYLSSIQGAINTMSLKLNILLLRDNFCDGEFDTANGFYDKRDIKDREKRDRRRLKREEPYYRRCVRKLLDKRQAALGSREEKDRLSRRIERDNPCLNDSVIGKRDVFALATNNVSLPSLPSLPRRRGIDVSFADTTREVISRDTIETANMVNIST